MVKFKFCLLLIATAGIWEASSSPVLAQVPRYRPPGGNPLPAALDYFRRDVGVLDPYNTFVAPRRQLNNQLEVMAARQRDDFRAATNEISSVRQSGAAPTGVSAGFMNYSHYYSRNAAGRSQSRR